MSVFHDDDDDEKYLFGPLIFTEVNSKRRPAVAKLLHTANMFILLMFLQMINQYYTTY